MSRTPETILKDEVVELLKNSGILYFRMNSGKVRVRGGFMQLAKDGTADLLVFTGQRPIWIELKGSGQKTLKARAEAQEAFADEVEALGHSYHRCESLEAVKAVIV